MEAAEVNSSILHEPCIIQFVVVSIMPEADIEPSSMAGKVVRQSNSVTGSIIAQNGRMSADIDS